MAREGHDYDDIPGTYVFDQERSRQGYGINMFCMSLMAEENRKAFKADEAQYLKRFELTPEQTEAILKRDYNRMLELGGNIYFTAKLGATDGHSFRYLAAEMTGSTQDDYADMMLAGGRPVDGNRSRSGKFERPGSMLAKAAPKASRGKGKPKAKAAKAAPANAPAKAAKTAKAGKGVKAAKANKGAKTAKAGKGVKTSRTKRG